jgi:phosphoenolpyruvate carboxykinase (GTP)
MHFNIPLQQWTYNTALIDWIEQQISLCKPKRVHLCRGTTQEYQEIAAQMVQAGTLVPLKKRPNSYWCHSHPDDVARVEECTFICSKQESSAGPTNHWKEPEEMKKRLHELFSGAMLGRTMYVIPYCMGPLASPYAKIGIEITDSPYVVLNMHMMTRMGAKALEVLSSKDFIPGLHSVGAPLEEGQKDAPWPCNPKQRVIAHFPEEHSIYSFGSGYGGNALLGKKCFALRIASALGRDQGWLAEHMLILGLTNPEGKKKYIAAAFPSACGKTNLAMLTPTIPGWKAECVGDDIAWMHFGQDGRLYAINPEAGFFGVAPGTSIKTNPNAMRTIEHNAMFTNVALTQDGDVWWEGIGREPPSHLISWLGQEWSPASKTPAAHPNSRFTVSAKQCPIYDKEAENPQGVPISAILFGGRREQLMPLVTESLSWNHGVFLGASLSSEMTAAAKGELGTLRHDPFAMLPFCGYHMGDYFNHWIELGKRTPPNRLPRIYSINWFRKDAAGKYLWPGYGDNSRVLKWIFERTDHQANALATPLGHIPTPEALDLTGLSVDPSALFAIDRKAWLQEAEALECYFKIFGTKFPSALQDELHALKKRLA